MSTSDFIATAEKVSGIDLDGFIRPWLERDDLPQPSVTAEVTQKEDKWQTEVIISQKNDPYHFLSTLRITTDNSNEYHMVDVKGSGSSFTFVTDEKPVEMRFNVFNDIPVRKTDYFTWSNFFDDFHHTKIVYGTRRRIEANHTLALRFSTMLADRYTEDLMPVIKDSEITADDLKAHDLIIIGNISDNNLMAAVADSFDLDLTKNLFRWQDQLYADALEGVFIALPNPYNTEKAVYLFYSNSALQLYHMTRERKRMPSWAVYHEDDIVDKGYHKNPELTIRF
jgi:hypothetical protein